MTQNLYVGADVGPVVAATTLPQLALAVSAAYAQVQANDFPERASALARLVEQEKPDLIGLQEASLLRTDTPPDGPVTPATTVTYDYLKILLDALAQQGLRYEIVAVLEIGDFEVPSASGVDVRLTDRIAMLARADLKTADLKLSNVKTGKFATFLTIPTLNGSGPPVESRRGWISVDAKIRGKSLRFITTQLVPLLPGFQLGEGIELLSGPASTSLPVVMAGDFNTRADGTGTATYAALTGAGFADAWSQVHPGDPGYTCCHAADLHQVPPPLNQRIDLVLTRGGLRALSVDVLGASLSDRTTSGLWPSDHAGVAAELGLP
jgi:endonuclease/exonuclease/phosphatase family metal-dependent hydrolase